MYEIVLASALTHGRRYVIIASLALAAAAGAFMLLGKSFMPTMDEGDLIMQLEKLPSIGLDQSLAVDTAVQQAILQRVPEVKAEFREHNLRDYQRIHQTGGSTPTYVREFSD